MKFNSILLALAYFFCSGFVAGNELSDDEPFYINEEDVSVFCETECVETDEWHFGFATGAGYISTPIADGKDTWLPIIPRFSYYGDRFFIDNFTLGYSFYQGESFTLDLIGEFNQDFLHFNSASNFQKAFVAFTGRDGRENIFDIGDYHLKDRYATYLAGPSFRYQGDVWSVKASYTSDISNLNHGNETVFEIGQHFDSGAWSFEHSFGAVRKSKELVDYYYGVDFEETPEDVNIILRWEAIYDAKEAATNTYYRMSTQYRYSKNWSFLISAKTERLDQSIIDSPLIDTDEVNSIFIGIGYDFD